MNSRYQTPEMDAIWRSEARNQIERSIWIAVMQIQAELGVPIPEEAIADYQRVADRLADPVGGPECAEELEIADIEREVKHDVYARLLYFNRQAGHEYAHWGMTSADVIENAQQVQLVESTRVVLEHGHAVARRLAALAAAEGARAMVGRTHGRPAQVTTVGKRVADWAVELTLALQMLEVAGDTYVPRGIKGAVGTRADMAALLARHGGEGIAGAEDLDARTTGDEALISTGQCYPRSADLPLVSALTQVAAACATVATGIRLWAVLGHANEVRADQQVGSSAMPHKANPRYSERVCGLRVIAQGYASMLQSIAGGMWFEGDVTTSSVRRVALPGLCHTVDAALANTAYALDRLQLDRTAIADDVRRHRVALSTGRILEACVAGGMDRARAHELIRQHADHAEALGLTAALPSRMADDPEIPLTYEQVEGLMAAAVDVEPAEAMVRQVLAALEQIDGEAMPDWPGDLL